MDIKIEIYNDRGEGTDVGMEMGKGREDEGCI